MKKTLLLLGVLVSFAVSGFAQGTIFVDNSNGLPGANRSTLGLMYLDTGTGAQLLQTDVNLVLMGGADAGSVTTVVASFLGASGITLGDGVISNPSGAKFSLANVLGGSTGYFQLFAWTGSSTTYAGATGAGVYKGASGIFTEVLASGLATPPSFDNMGAVTLVAAVPEPATIALGVMGLSTLLFRRRK